MAARLRPAPASGNRLRSVFGDGERRRYTVERVDWPTWGSVHVKKGRHRRFEEARALKRNNEVAAEPCPECGADPEDDHASWCLASEDEDLALKPDED
jgi:hypothetical protein